MQTITGLFPCYLISIESLKKWSKEEWNLLSSKRLYFLHHSMVSKKYTLLNMLFLTCECYSDKYGPAIIFMWSLYWLKKKLLILLIIICYCINRWLSSYLQGQTQTTQIGPHVSSRVGITCGVPQGFVLGPLLFLLYINDIHVSFDKLNFYLFADDTNILYANKNLKLLELIVNQELCKLYVWLTANKLTLNIKKKL